MWGKILDASIVASFDKRGFLRHQRSFADPEMDVDLSGRTYIITGGNGGIGYAIAQALVARGGRVYLLCRNPERGADAARRLRAHRPGAECHLAVVDISLVSSVRRFLHEFREPRVDGLILNAGVLPRARSETAEGVELAFATNVLGGFCLVAGLRAQLAAAGGRVVHVSSGGMYLVKLKMRDWQWAERPYDGVRAYAMTKRAQAVLTRMWHEELSADGIHVHAMHPGWVDTPGVRDSLPGFYESRHTTLRTPEQGADTAVWLTIAPAATLPGGRFWFDRKPRNPYRVPFTRESARECDALWALCTELANMPANAAEARTRALEHPRDTSSGKG